MTEDEMRQHRCCFTGHRPDKLHRSEADIIGDLSLAIDSAIDSGYTTFISGMAMGVDIWAGELVLSKKLAHPEIKLICALPFTGFGDLWSGGWSDRYRHILNNADLVRSISPSFSYASYQKRNEWMVDHSSLLISVYNGTAGGTKNTIDYANKLHISNVTIQG